MIGSSILKLIPEHLHSDEKTIIESIRAGQRVKHFETVRVTKDGRFLDVSLTVSPLKNELGRVIGASKILRDISGRKRFEQSLLQAEKIAATGRMAATIAHEVNNPLEAVTNLLYLLRPILSTRMGSTTSTLPKMNSAASLTSPIRRWAIIGNIPRRGEPPSRKSYCMQSRSMSHGVRQLVLK